LFLLLYDIAVEKDPHGIRVRLVRSLRRNGAFQLQRSAWLVERLSEDVLSLADEYRAAGGSIKVSEWLPRTLSEVSAKGAGHLRVVAVAPLGGEPISEGWHRRVKKLLEAMGYRTVLEPVGESAWTELRRREKAPSRRQEKDSRGKSMSRALDEIALKDIDGIVLLNSGRSAQSGMVFGAQTIANTMILKGMTSLPMIQVERAGKDDGMVLIWNESGTPLGKRIAEEFRLTAIKPSLEAKIVTMEGGREVRQIHYARLGDEVIVNDHRVGVCLSDQVYLIAEGGTLVDIMGGKMRKKEAQRLRFGSISDVTVKTMSRI
jgi:hypothetical protein